MIILPFFVLCTIFLSSIPSPCDGVIVKVKQGLVSGKIKTLYNGKNVFTFHHIPYAQPPVGKRRFKDPEPIKSWSGVWNASIHETDLIKCLQFAHVPGGPYQTEGYEDCLYLNIYTPQVPQSGDTSNLQDVIVYIHGGAFMFGKGHSYKPYTLLAEKNLVYVSLNYRLGPLGFLSTGDDVVPGNMGIKDQTEALRWIKENIAQFGGNPNSITISGMSAGGASVHFQMLSPSAKGLFHKAISMSGTSLCPWTIAENLPEKTKLVADDLGCPVENNKEMVECLRSRPAQLITNAVRLSQPFMYNPFSPWAPTIDSFAKNPVLLDYPAELIKQGKIADVPWLESITTAEGLYPAAEIIVEPNGLTKINDNWNSVIPFILDFNHTVSEDLKDKTSQEIRNKYFGDKPVNRANFEPFVRMISDRMFNVDAERAARFQSGVLKSPVYFYEFNFRGRYSLSNIYGRTLENFGVSHADDTQYVIQWSEALVHDIPENELEIIKFMTNLYESFAKTGKPHIDSWKPVTPESFNYLRINTAEDFKLIENAPEIAFRSFWDSLPIEEKTIWKSSTGKKEEL